MLGFLGSCLEPHQREAAALQGGAGVMIRADGQSGQEKPTHLHPPQGEFGGRSPETVSCT